jgi:hypothetical protein
VCRINCLVCLYFNGVTRPSNNLHVSAFYPSTIRFGLQQVTENRVMMRFLVTVSDTRSNRIVWSDTSLSTSLGIQFPILIEAYHTIDVSYMDSLNNSRQPDPYRYFNLNIHSEHASGSSVVPFDYMVDVFGQERLLGSYGQIVLQSTLRSYSRGFGGFTLKLSFFSERDGNLDGYFPRDILTLSVYAYVLTELILHILCVPFYITSFLLHIVYSIFY